MGRASVLRISRNGQEIRSVSLKAGVESVLGREEGCVIRLEDRAVSRKHAVFLASGSEVRVENHSEFGPLSVNGAEVTSAVLRDGDVVSIGPYLIQLKAEQAAKMAAQMEAPSHSLPPASLSLVVPHEHDAQDREIEPPRKSEKGIQISEDGEIDSGGDTDSSGMPELEVVNHELSSGGDNGQVLDLAESMEALSKSSELSSPGESEGVDSSGPVLDEAAVTRFLSPDRVSASLHFKAGDANVEEVLLSDPKWDRKEITLGRGKECSIILNDKKASRKNTLITREGAKFLVSDLESVNGTFLNGEKIPANTPTALSHGDLVRVGDVEFEFKALSKDYQEQAVSLQDLPAVEEDRPSFEIQAPEQSLAPEPMEFSPAHAPSPALGAGGEGSSVNMGSIAGLGPSVAKKTGLMEKFRAMPQWKQLLYGAGLMALIWYGTGEDEEKPVKSKKKPKADSAKVEKDSKTKRAFQMLTPEQKKFIEAQYQISFDLYKSREYDKTLFELAKIFALVDDFEKARELERYAKEGKRKLEALDEEKRRKEEESRIKNRLESLINETRTAMSAKKFDRAQVLFAEILSIDPDNKDVQAWKAEIQGVIEKAEMEKSAAYTRSLINKKAWAVFQEAVSLKKKGEFYAAIDRFKEVLVIQTTDKKIVPQAQREITKIEAEIQSRRDPLLATAKQAEVAGEFKNAYHAYQLAYKVDPRHPAAPAGMKRLKDVLNDRAKRLYTEAVIAESFSDFTLAKNKYQECVSTAPADDIYHSRAERKLANYYRHETPPAGEIPSGLDESDGTAGAEPVKKAGDSPGTENVQESFSAFEKEKATP